MPDAGFELVNIKMSGLRRGFSPGDIMHNIKTGKNLLTATFKSARLVKELEPTAVIGTGGYISYPVLKQAAKYAIPTFVLEPNAYPGLAIKMLSGIVDKVFVTYKGMETRYKRPERVVYTGTPLRSEFFNVEPLTVKKEKPLVISYWGSIGAKRMNERMLEFIKLNSIEGKFKHIHATGVDSSVEEMKSKLKNLGISDINSMSIEIKEYIDDMPSVMRTADIVLSRAGASTIAELTALAKPAILVPSPNVTENHQEENAKQLQQAGSAIMIREDECTGEKLYKTVSDLLDDEKRLASMSKKQKLLSVDDAATRIIDIILEYCN